MRIGVLALQGAFEEHIKMLNALGVETFEIRQLKDLSEIPDGLIIPGGESTVMSKLLDELNIRSRIIECVNDGMCVFGTCAGLILLCKDTGDERCKGLGLLNCQAKRNAYGRQLGSFQTTEEFKGLGKIPMVFIRAPYVSFAEDDVEVLSTVDDKIVAVANDKTLATAFHPELTADLSVHKYFIDMIKNR